MISKYIWLIYTQLPPKLVNVFIELGFDAVHTQSYSEGIFMSYTEIRKIAFKENKIKITKDNDFYNSHFKDAKMPTVLFLKIGNISNRELMILIKNNLSSTLSVLDKEAKLIMIEKSKLYVF